MAQGWNIASFIFILIGFICQCVAVGIPYWYYVDSETYGGLWYKCQPFPGCYYIWKRALADWFRAVQATQCIGVVLGFLATALNGMYIGFSPLKKFYVPQVVCCLVPLTAGASVVAGIVVYGLKMESGLGDLHAGFILACVAAALLCIGSMMSCCGKRPAKE